MLKKWFRISAKCTLLTLLIIGLPIGSAMAKPAKVFLLAGQSNMGGQAGMNVTDARADFKTKYDKEGGWNWNDEQDDVQIWSYVYKNRDTKRIGTEWKTLALGFGLPIGPELSFGRAMSIEYSDHDIYLIKYAKGGSSLAEQWNPPDPESGVAEGEWLGLFKVHFANALTALEENGVTDYEIAGMIWMQGEADAGVFVRAEAYEENLPEFIAHIRGLEFGQNGKIYPNMPFIIGRITPHYGSIDDKSKYHKEWEQNPIWDWNDTDNHYRKPNLVRSAQEHTANTTKNVEWFDTDDLIRTAAEGGIGHYDLFSQIELGDLFAAAYIGAQFVDNYSISLTSLDIILDDEVLPDTDADGIPDSEDNCLYTSNADQLDTGGVGTTVSDGIGDACQCGDLNDDGVVDSNDAHWINHHWKKDLSWRSDDLFLNKCNVNTDSICDNTDMELITHATQNKNLTQNCVAAGAILE